jgi:hypothetical protein
MLAPVVAVATILIRSNLSDLVMYAPDDPSDHLRRLMHFTCLWAVIFLTSGGVTYAVSNWILKVALTLLAVVAAVFFLINANLVARITASV